MRLGGAMAVMELSFVYSQCVKTVGMTVEIWTFNLSAVTVFERVMCLVDMDTG